MQFPGFVGPSYTSLSPIADGEKAKNLFTEQIESGIGRNRATMYSRPGLSTFCTLADSPLRALFSQDGRLFAVAGGTFYEIFADGTFIPRGLLANAMDLATISSNGFGGNQLFVVAGGFGYIYNLNTNLLTLVTATAPFFPNVIQGVFSDSFFLALQVGANTLWSSSPEDGTAWSAGDVGQRSTSSDNLQAMAINHRELWLFGSLTTEVWGDSGVASGFPYAPIPGAFIEQGAFRWSVATLDNTLFFVGQNRHGQGMGFRAEGYNPQRITNHAVEAAWAQFQTIEDVETFCYQEMGHSFWVVNFPTAQATWVYDVSNGMWHERDWFNAATAQYESALPRVHASAFGMHFVGDRRLGSGKVFRQSLSIYDDDGVAIHRRRRAPHLCKENDWVRHNSFELVAEMGLGVPSDATVVPQATLRWSNDGGKTWSNDYTVSLGKTGEYGLRALWSRLGRARDRVYEIEIVENMPVRLIDAYLNVDDGNGT